MWAWFKSLPWYVQVIILAIILYIIYEIYSYFKNQANASNYNAAVGQSQTAITQLAAAGIIPSYGQAQYTSMANALKTTFSGCGMDWSGTVVPTLQQMKNDADIYSLIAAYGVQSIPECVWGTFSGDLSATLAYKTGGFVFTGLSTDIFTSQSIGAVNTILKQNGLTFQF